MKHREKVNPKKIKIIEFLTLIMGLGQATLVYVMSTYFQRALGYDNVGIFYLMAYLIVLLALFNMHKAVKKAGRSFIFQLAFIFKILALVFLIFLQPSFLGILFLMIYMVAGSLAWVAMDLMLESFSEDKLSGRIRGAHLLTLNAGILVGPLISSRLLEQYDFAGIFFFSLLLHSFVFIMAVIFLRGTNHRFKREVSFSRFIKKISKRRNVLRIYYISFVMEFFYALMLIFVPFYLFSLGFGWNELGVAFTIMLIPFLIVQYPLGFLADKKAGEKEFLIVALLIVGIFTLWFFFLESSNIMTWTWILLGGRVGIAMIEILRDSYFYKRIDGNDVEIIDFFRTAKPVAYIVGAGVSSIVLLFFSVKAIFLLVALVSLSALYPAYRLVDNKSEEEQEKEIKILKKIADKH